jgi:hypothetical protein
VENFVVQSTTSTLERKEIYEAFVRIGGTPLRWNLFCDRFAKFSKEKGIKRAVSGRYWVSIMEYQGRGNLKFILRRKEGRKRQWPQILELKRAT